MLPQLCPPVPPFHPAYPRAWFMRLDAILAVNGIKAQPMMHAVLRTPSRLRPYDDLCAAVLACYGQTYRPLPGSREFQISPLSQGGGPTGPQPSLNQNFTPPATTPPTSRPATCASIPAPDDVAATIDHSATRCVSSTPSADGPSGMPAIRPSSLSSPAHDTSLTSASTLATLPHDLEADTDNLSPAVRPSLAEVSPSTVSEHDFSLTSKLCASCQQRPASPSTSTAAEVRAPYQLRPHLQDAATIYMTEAPEDDMPAGSPEAAQQANVTPATTADVQHPDQRTGPHVPSNIDASPSAGAPSEPAETRPARLHHGFPAELLTQDAAHPTSAHHPGALITAPTMTNRTTGVSRTMLRRFGCLSTRPASMRAGAFDVPQRNPRNSFASCRLMLTPTIHDGVSSRTEDNVHGVRAVVPFADIAGSASVIALSHFSWFDSNVYCRGCFRSYLPCPFVATLARFAAPRAARQRLNWFPKSSVQCPRVDRAPLGSPCHLSHVALSTYRTVRRLATVGHLRGRSLFRSSVRDGA
ncbi:hypothetical protein HPB52_001621 [Rhipicephalus sanguineus]|uniref:Uncharacterized protein n=1 Tax=Rhipicephalus sanguineus TaxID=34632 RepID=A0A9D4PMK0_RHISA|nr:hypothetical protein HPB52_001621 [Rhipicephalus sanguineus]